MFNMRQKTQVLLLLCALGLSMTDGRRVRVRPARPPAEDSEQEDQQQLEYYTTASPRARTEEPEQVVVIAEQDPYNGLYGRALERAGTDTQYQRPLARTAVIAAQSPRQARIKDTPKEPPVQTIRNYSKVNDDGSFTFGYEAADGSFKEETRGTDCVVRGKYGYVDPDGNKREFTYVSGNPCDPNAPDQEEKEEAQEDSSDENIPQNIPRRPIPQRPLRPAVARPTTTLFQQSFNSGAQQESEDEDEPQQLYVNPATRARLPAPRLRPQVVRVTPRPVSSSPNVASPTLPATTYRPQLLVSVTPRPNLLYTKQGAISRPTPTASPLPASTVGSVDFDAELKKFRLDNSIRTTARPVVQSSIPTSTLKAATPTGQPIYTSELVFDPSSGQYNTVVYQQLPKTTGELNVKTRLPQYVPQVRPQQQSNVLQQQLFQQQQQNLFQQSQDLYNQQRQQQQQIQPHRFQSLFPSNIQIQQHPATLSPAATKPIQQTTQSQPLQQQRLIPRPSSPQQYYYFAPQGDGQSFAAGQIDAFLRGHNIAF